MISDLIQYIEDARKLGFALEEIQHHLSNHGWNDYLIEYAVKQVEKKNDRRWLQSSVMAVLVIVLASAATVWWVNAPSANPVCVVESMQGSVTVYSDAPSCCVRIPRHSCTHTSGKPHVRDQTGAEVFSPDMSCRTAEGVLLTTKRVLDECAKNV